MWIILEISDTQLMVSVYESDGTVLLEGVVSALKWEKFMILGHSMGELVYMCVCVCVCVCVCE